MLTFTQNGRWASLQKSPLFRAGLLLTLAGTFALSGCQKIKLIPVKGKVTLDGKPVEGTVVFSPVETQSGGRHLLPTANVDAQGNYELKTEGRAGAPLGKYKATFQTGKEYNDEMGPKEKARAKAMTRTGFPKTPATVDIEVKEGLPPGSYDLKLTR